MKRPFCGQCVSRGLKCDGYESPTVFINTTMDDPQVLRRHRRRQPREEQQPRQYGTAQILPLLAPDPDGDRCLARSAYEETYLSLFWNAYLPRGRQITPRVMRYTGGGWTNILPQLIHTSPTIRRILLAFSLTTAGHLWDRRQEKDEGLRYYSNSLRDMSAALADPKRASKHAALCLVARLYSLYEVSEPSDRLHT